MLASVVEHDVRLGQLERMVHSILFDPDEKPDVIGFAKPDGDDDANPAPDAE